MNLFYKMQIIHELNRNVFVVCTRWGRIGESGQHQQTPFSIKEEAIKEFTKIFASKSGNKWEDKAQFVKKTKKYKLMQLENKVDLKNYLVPFDYKHKQLPVCGLSRALYWLLFNISNVKLYQSYLDQSGIDVNYMPIDSLSYDTLIDAQSLLEEMRGQIELIQVEQRNYMNCDIQKVLTLQEKIADESSKFYELIPHTQYRDQAVPSINNLHLLNEKCSMLTNLLDIELVCKILLGAHLNFF